MRLTNCLRDYKKVGELTKKYANLPEKYIERSMEKVSGNSFRKKKPAVFATNTLYVGSVENTAKQSSLFAENS